MGVCMVELTDQQIEASITMAKEAIRGIVDDKEEKAIKELIRNYLDLLLLNIDIDIVGL